MSELRVMLEDAVTRLFGDRVTRECVEAAERGAWQGDLWRAVEENGLTRPHLPEDAGGAGGSWLEAYVILRASGRYTVPLPLAETVLASWLLTEAKIDVPDGPLTIVPTAVDAAVLGGEAVTLDVADVPWASVAAHIVVAADTGDGLRVALLSSASAAEIRGGQNIAREPRDGVRFVAAPVLASAQTTLTADVVHVYGAMVRSAQMAGAMEALLAQSVQYAGERVQFGRAIAKFQVIQHELAKLAGAVAASGAAAEAAFVAATRGHPRFEIAVAKTRIGDAVDQATSIAHQVHGAIGFTYEHGLHFATRRLWAWRSEFGSDAYWAEELGRAALARGADALWPDLTARGR